MKTDQPPEIRDPAALEHFRTLARGLGLDPDDPWIGGYVPYEWNHGRHFFQAYAPELGGRRVLEFGCNIGGSAIILASLGANVVGVEIEAGFVSLANAHVRAYGLEDRVDILHQPDTSRMPFDDHSFDMIVCNSVLEYVQPRLLMDVQHEIRRVLAPGGLILVMSTSSRLWPREVHSGRWLSNYLPRGLDGLLGDNQRQRGVSPFTVLRGFKGCTLVDSEDGCARYLLARERMGTSDQVVGVLRLAARLLRPFGMTIGMLTPSFSLVLRERQGAASR